MPHIENPDVVGQIIGVILCFRNDGMATGNATSDCSGVKTQEDDGLTVLLLNSWFSSNRSGMTGCGVADTDSVSSANCPLTFNVAYAFCTANDWVLMQTTKSGRYFSARGNGACNGIADLKPCSQSDVFTAASGCTPTDEPSQLSIEAGYLKPGERRDWMGRDWTPTVRRFPSAQSANLLF